MSYLILRTDKIKTMGQLAALSAHHSRTRPTPNADSSREVEFLVGTGTPDTDVRHHLETHALKHRKNGVLAIEVLLTASPDYFRPGSPESPGVYDSKKVDAFTAAALPWLNKYFGKQNVVSVVLHLDEATPHLQAVVVPMDTSPRKRGPQCRLNARRWLGGKVKMSAMQTNAANAFKHLGLKRGIKGSTATHKTLKEYYGDICRPINQPTVSVPAPPMLLTGKARKQWAVDTENHLCSILTRQLKPLLTAHKKARTADSQRKDALATAERKSREVEQLRAKTRDIPLHMIFNDYGWQKDSYDKSKWRGPNGGTISITGPLWNHWALNKGGRGAIDLTIHLEKLQSGSDPDFKQVLAMLTERFGIIKTAGAVAANAAVVVKETTNKAKPFIKPEKVEANWSAVRRYLIEQRGLRARMVDHFHESGLIYADERTNAVFWNTKEVAELRGTGTKSWRGLVTGSKRMRQGGFRFLGSHNPGKRIVLVESAIDALSYFQLKLYGEYMVISTCGALATAPFIKAYQEQGYEVLCAYDNDTAGNEAYRKMGKNIERELPPFGCKDWNEAIFEFNRADTPVHPHEDENPEAIESIDDAPVSCRPT